MRLRVLAIALVPLFGCKSSDPDKSGPPAKGTNEPKAKAVDAAVAPPAKPLGNLAADPGASEGAPKWALPIGGLGSDVARDLVALPTGGVAVCGDFEEDATFGALGKKTSAGKSDAFVMVVDADGKPKWVATLGGPEAEVCNAIAVDKDGNIAIGGLFGDTMTGGGLTAKSNGSDDMFVAAYHPDGQPDWLWSTGGNASDAVRTIVAAPDGGFLVAGDFFDEVPFGADKLKAKAFEDAFLAKIVDGKVAWARRYGGDRNDRIVRLALDPAGSIFAAAEFEMKSDWGGDKPLDSNGGFDFAIVKLDGAGNHVWSKSFGGTDNDNALGLAVDPAGNVTISGSFDATITVGKDTYKTAGNADILLARLDTGGNLVWSKTFGGAGEDVADSVVADASGNVIATGWFEKDIDLGKGKVTSKGNKDAFVVKLGPDGATRWAQTFGDKDHDKGHALAVDKDGNPYLAGIFRFTMTLPSGSFQQVMNPDERAPKSDAFVMRLDR